MKRINKRCFSLITDITAESWVGLDVGPAGSTLSHR